MPAKTSQGANRDGLSRVTKTMTELVGIPSVTDKEEQVRDYLAARLSALGLKMTVDLAGNLVAEVPGTAGLTHLSPLLFNAHMDRVPPGRGQTPILRDGRMYSDGTTNLGADDSAGLTIILLTVENLLTSEQPHGPLVILFTVGEEKGQKGALAFDPEPWGIQEGIVFDNAGEPGALVVRGAAYIAFDVEIHGHGGHPGKDLDGTVSAIDIFRKVRLQTGPLDEGNTRLSLGVVSGGTARNQIAETAKIQGELRTFSDMDGQAMWRNRIETAFIETAQKAGGDAQVTFDPHGAFYTVDVDEPLALIYRKAWESTGNIFSTMSTFVGSDTNTLRQRLKVFTVSTGAVDEHTVKENIPLEPLADMVEAATYVAVNYRTQPRGSASEQAAW